MKDTGVSHNSNIHSLFKEYTGSFRLKSPVKIVFLLTCMSLYIPPISLFVFYALLFALLFVLDFPIKGNEIKINSNIPSQ